MCFPIYIVYQDEIISNYSVSDQDQFDGRHVKCIVRYYRCHENKISQNAIEPRSFKFRQKSINRIRGNQVKISSAVFLTMYIVLI